MSNQRIKIPRLPDRTIVETFKELGRGYQITVAHVNALGFSNLGQVDLTADSQGELEALLNLDSTLIDTMSLQIRGLGISYARGGQYPPEQKSPIYDEIVLTYNQQGNLDNKEKLKIVAFINKELKAFEPGRFVGQGVSEEQNHLIAIHENTLERLELLNENLIKQSADFRKKLEEQFDVKINKIDEANSKQKDLLEEEYNKKSNLLEDKEKLLENKLKAIDDRDNTHVRREIRDRMLDDVKSRIQNFGVSEITAKKRKPVMVGMFLLIATLGMMLLLTASEIMMFDNQHHGTIISMSNMSASEFDKLKTNAPNKQLIENTPYSDADNSKMYVLWFRLSLYSFGLLGSIIYYIKWQNKWAEQHANSEFQLQQFYIDVNRANWIIESCLEWRKETQSTLPKTLIESISRNLFVKDQSELERVIHPADQLASALMGRASKLKLNLGDNELEFNKPGKIPNKPLRVKTQTESDS